MPFLLDTFDFKTTTKTKDKFGVANYFPLYFGQLKDTLVIDYKIRLYPPPPQPMIVYQPVAGKDSIVEPDDKYKDFRGGDEHEAYEDYFTIADIAGQIPWDSAIIQIHIDTTRTIANLDFGGFQDSTFAFKAYPVLLTNMTDQTAVVGYGTHIALTTEVKDKNGQWRPIERPYTYMCGTGLPIIILPPSESVLTSAPIYQGDFDTDIRLRIGDNFSQTFKGTVNLT